VDKCSEVEEGNFTTNAEIDGNIAYADSKRPARERFCAVTMAGGGRDSQLSLHIAAVVL